VPRQGLAASHQFALFPLFYSFAAGQASKRRCLHPNRGCAATRLLSCGAAGYTKPGGDLLAEGGIMRREEIQSIVADGAGVIVDGRNYAPGEIEEMARAAKRSGALVLVRHAGNLSPGELRNIAKAAAGRILLDLSADDADFLG